MTLDPDPSDPQRPRSVAVLVRELPRCRLTAEPPGTIVLRGPIDRHLIHVNLLPAQARWSIAGVPPVTETFPGRAICWAPAGRTLDAEMTCMTWTLFVSVAPEAAERLFASNGATYRVPTDTLDYVIDTDAAAIAAIAVERLRHGADGVDDAMLSALTDALVLRAGRLAAPVDPGGARPVGVPVDARIARTVSHVHDRLDDDLSLQALASVAGMSHSHFARTFAAAMGTPAGDFVRGVRLDRAKLLLRHGDAPIAQVAQLCGFRDQSAMTAVFRRRLGVSPASFRRGEEPGRPRP